MFIQQAIQAVTGYDGYSGERRYKKVPTISGYQMVEISPEEQRSNWAYSCMQAEGALAGLAVTVVYASNPENQGPGAGDIIPLYGIFNMCVGTQVIQPIYALSYFRQASGLLKDNRLGYVLDGALLGALLAGFAGDMKSLPNTVGIGAGIGAGCAAIAKTVSSIVHFVRDHAEYLDA